MKFSLKINPKFQFTCQHVCINFSLMHFIFASSFCGSDCVCVFASYLQHRQVKSLVPDASLCRHFPSGKVVGSAFSVDRLSAGRILQAGIDHLSRVSREQGCFVLLMLATSRIEFQKKDNDTDGHVNVLIEE